MIETKNDGKGKCQSWEAKIVDDSLSGMGNYSASFTGYGSTEYESKINAINQVDILIKKLKRLKDQLDIY